jgi:type VI secretion system ImpM family protein
MSTLSGGCFGKLPFYGDFIRVHGERAPVQAIERWFQSGALEPGSARAGAFAASGPSFCVAHEHGQWWGIAQFPSQDQVGRRHPFALFAALPAAEAVREVGVLPMLFIPFFARAMQAAARGWPSSATGVKEMVATLAASVDPAGEEARLMPALDSCSVRELWQALLGEGGAERAGAVLGSLVGAVADKAVHGVRIQPMAHQVHLSFWLMLAWLLRERPGMPALLAMHPGAAARAPSACVLYDRPSVAACFAALWPECATPEAREGIHDLGAAAGRHQPIAPEVAGMDPDATLRDLLHGVVAHARQARASRAR